MRFLFFKIRMHYNAKSLSFIDDVAIYVENKTVEQNCKKIEHLIKIAFNWVSNNIVLFDDSKSELIYFEKCRTQSKITVTLPNNTILKSQKIAKWLGILFEPKIEF